MSVFALLCAYMAFICGCMACAMAVYIVGYTVMAYGLGLRVRRWDRRWV